MANKAISMSKVRQIIKLYSQGIGKKKIATRLAVSKNTVKEYVITFIKLKTPWDELSKLTDFELNKLFQQIAFDDKRVDKRR
jgi:transposase